MTSQLDEIVSGFHANGYVIIRDFIPEREIHQIESEIDKVFCKKLDALKGGDIFFEDDQTTVRQIENLQRYSQYFTDVSGQERYIDLFKRVFWEKPLCMNASYMAKAAHIGSSVPAHQDNGYFNLVPNHALTFWIALDECTEDNGCLRVIPGSHRHGILPHKASGQVGNSSCLAEPPNPVQAGEVAVLLKRGDCSIHHVDTIHSSLANTSDHPRRGFLVAYQSIRCEVDSAGMASHHKIVAEMHATIAARGT